MKNDFHTLITNMKALRIFSGSSQEQTSASLHLSRSTYASYESGLRMSDLVYASMEELIMLQIHYQKNESLLRDVLPLYESLSPFDKSRIMEQIDILKREELLVISLYHSCDHKL